MFFPFPGLIQTGSLSAQTIGTFHQMGFIPLLGQTQGGRHTGDPAADDQRGLTDGQFGFHERLFQGSLADGHAYQVFGLLGGDVGIVLMHPGILVADIDHFEQVFIEPGVDQGFLKQGLVGFGRAGPPPPPG